MKLVKNIIEKEVDLRAGPGLNISLAKALDRLIKVAKEFEDEGIDPDDVKIEVWHRSLSMYIITNRPETEDEKARRLAAEEIVKNERYSQYQKLKKEFEPEE